MGKSLDNVQEGFVSVPDDFASVAIYALEDELGDFVGE